MSGVTGLDDDTYIRSSLRLFRLLSSSVKVASSGVCTAANNIAVHNYRHATDSMPPTRVES